VTQETQIQLLLKKLAVPAQDVAQLSFCRSAKEAHIKEWLQNLPLTQAQQVSAPIYTAVHELSRLPLNSDQRLAILELLRTPLDQTLTGLARKYLNQPLILPEAALKTATIAQAIQKHFLNNYLVLVRQLCQKVEIKKEDQERQALVIARALTALGLLLLRSYQLYLPIASQVWAEIHTLYQIAQTLNISQLPIDDRLPHQQGLQTAQNRYLRLLLLATARPNQLRQDEIENTYKLLETLAGSAELDSYAPVGKENLFVVLTHSNRAPIYKSHWRPNAATDTHTVLELRTTHLLTKLDDFHKSPDEHPITLSPALAKHLNQAWSHLALRSFERQDINIDIEVTVGLTNIHFHLADEQAFNVFLQRSSNSIANAPEKDNIFKKRGIQLKDPLTFNNDDPWGNTFEIKGTALEGKALPTLNIEKQLLEQEKSDYQGRHPIYTVPLVDRSLGGYGLEWRGEIPAQVRAGELLGLRERGRNKWAIGVVRWAHQIKGATQLGVQILAPQAVPIGIALVQKTGEFAEYLRAVQIPELRAINQSASIITNAVSFHEYNKARIYYQAAPGITDASEKSIQLTQRLFATGAVSQFGFRELMTRSTEPPTKKDDLDSVWK
jgi:hypothetical protein